jgi:tartrate dehydratase beta subunit/fumarate hydratase class I family protein
MEAMRELEVQKMPVVVAVDSKGCSIHAEGPEAWKTILKAKARPVHG